MKFIRKYSLFFSHLCIVVFFCGCTSSRYAQRDVLYENESYVDMHDDAMANLEVLGQIDVDGDVESEIVYSNTNSFETKYYHDSELAHILVPLSYHDMARAFYKTHRYVDALRSAKESMKQGAEYYQNDRWFMLRIVNLEKNYKILYESYTMLGDMEEAAKCFKEYLYISEIINSNSFRKLCSQVIALRMGSLLELSDYRSRNNWATCTQIYVMAITISAAVAILVATEGRGWALASAILALGVATTAAIEVYKSKMLDEHNINVALIMKKAEMIGKLPVPTKEDINRVKMASRFYFLANASDVTNVIDKAKYEDIQKLLDGSLKKLAFESSEDGEIRITGNLPLIIDNALKIDAIPLQLPSPEKGNEGLFLDKYLNAKLFKIAGLKMTPEELEALNDVADSPVEGDTYEINPDTENGKTVLRALNKLKIKNKETAQWLSGL